MSDVLERIAAAICDERDVVRMIQEGGMVALILPAERAHAARVALSPRLAGDTTSKSSQKVRDALDKALARVVEVRG
ncbi:MULTISPECIES: hypothetical protein [unclassified Mameliella]|uniref:hypothetical protein n=1 Tax=unclassified Mameliella TaxID=2630630 RepID=UPI00273D95A8|nr:MULTISPECIES: hypothetical protein [unclassified Mameliella]